MAVSAEVLAAAMFAALAGALLVGFPVAFSVAAVAAVFGVAGVAAGHFQPAFLLAGTLRVEGFFHNDNLLAIRLFVFMGMLLERTGLAADMLHALDELLAAVRGGMAYTVVLVGASLAAITGFVSAAVIGLGLIALPAMLRRGYDARLATGVVAASGTLAQMLPPSLVLIVLAEQLEVPLMDMFRGALLPSALLVLLYLLYIFFAARLWPQRVPAMPGEVRLRPLAQRSRTALVAAGFPIGLILLVLASVYFGVATPTEGGAVGVTGAVALGLMRRKLDLRRLQQASERPGRPS
ncbi:MAG: TRAP transporter large permease subunit [Aquincola sp.]|nr:TRAP transporter large permease subunit [Aquincola sp.]